MAKGIRLLSLYIIILTEQPFPGKLIRRKVFCVHQFPGVVVLSMRVKEEFWDPYYHWSS